MPPLPRKRPKQSRSQLLVKSIQEACLRILNEEGADQLTTQHIADVAGINIASLYQYFPNKEAVLTTIYEEELKKRSSEASRQIQQILKLSRQSLEATLSAIIDLEASQLLQLYELNPEFYRQYQHSFDMHRRVNEITQAMQNPSWEDWFPRFLRYHQDRLRVADMTTMSFIARSTLESNLQAALAERPALLQDQVYKSELLTLLLNYLLKP